jgi:hypothetical protein
MVRKPIWGGGVRCSTEFGDHCRVGSRGCTRSEEFKWHVGIGIRAPVAILTALRP